MSKRATFLLLVALFLPLGLAAPLAAQEESEPAPAVSAPASDEVGQARRGARREQAESRRLPPAVTTEHQITIGGETIEYQAIAGSIVLEGANGRAEADIAFVAYFRKGADPQQRPITFAFNGGPGAASAYLHLGALGPKRLSFGNEGEVPSSPPVLSDNEESWLAFTDLVFVDPVGTGFSRFLTDDAEVRRRYWSVEGDISALGSFVWRFLNRYDRLASPKALVGESYGGFRVPKLARALQTRFGVGVGTLVMISPVLDFALIEDGPVSPLAPAARLPSFAATALERAGKTVTSRAQLAEAERYAEGPFLTDFLLGPRDRKARERLIADVTRLTGLDEALVRRFAGRVDLTSFVRELHRDRERVGSYYDGNVTALDPAPFAARSEFDDPVLDGSVAPLTSASVDYLARALGYRVDARYHLLNREVSGRWNWGSGRRQPEVLSDLAAVLALDGKAQALVVHGFTDLVTPYFSSKLALDQLPALGSDGARVGLEVLPGGHMFYTRDTSRRALKEAVRPLYERVK